MTQNALKPEESKRSATILVVEDELFIRLATADDLREAGFRVVEAADGEEAAAILESGVEVDLVFSDVRMPGPMDGLDLGRLVLERHPHVALVHTSGHAEPGDGPIDGEAFMAKPYTSAALIEIVRAALRAQGRVDDRDAG